ncbi:hypothetical protein EON83_09955 [bacterium]|nr:MAG: hypothetical protein EON83_09955 [bacterium]
MKHTTDFVALCDETNGHIRSIKLFGEELLDTDDPCESELWVNGQPLALRTHLDPNQPAQPHFKGEKWVGHFSGWSLVLSRKMGERAGLKHRCFGIQSLVRRELCDAASFLNPGPGGPPIEAPLWLDTLSLLNWNWKFWGDDTRMIFPSSHSQGPSDQHGHIGYENDAPETVKSFLQNSWRRVYPGVMVVHGGLFYNAKTAHWIAITCRRPGVGYMLNIDDAGRGVSYDFTLHSHFGLGQSLRLPEIKLYYGADHDSMMSWLADYTTFYYQEVPDWVHQTTWGDGLAWNNAPTWTQQADAWEKELDKGTYSGINYSLVTNRPISSGTTPLGYEPDPNHGSQDEFRAMGQRLKARGVPWLVWMSHSGIEPGGEDIDDDWFIKGIDGRVSAGWGSIDFPELAMCNPGHPGYIEYTKKWIRFYMKECGARGIFFDCLGWAFPLDFAPRDFMRFPGDTNRMAVKFMEEMYACIKECDSEGIMLGEGTTLEGPVNIFSIAGNPVRAVDNLGPRDFFLQLNRYSSKKMVIDQGGNYFPASGMNKVIVGEQWEEQNRFFANFIRENGGRESFVHLPGDISLLNDLLFVALPDEPPPHTRRPVSRGELRLPKPWTGVVTLRDLFAKGFIERSATGAFMNVPPGIYRME